MPESPLEKNANKNYAALGRFVEAFEMMVGDVRAICIERVCQEVGIATEGHHLIEIAFYHGAMTAKPLFDIMRAIIAEIVNRPSGFHYENREVFKKILGVIEDEYNRLSNKRNELLHGTWFVGYPSSSDPHAEEFIVQKYKTSAEGLTATELPKNATELSDLIDRCEQVRLWLGQLDYCLLNRALVTKFFRQDPPRKGPWKTFLSDGHVGTTLPKK